MPLSIFGVYDCGMVRCGSSSALYGMGYGVSGVVWCGRQHRGRYGVFSNALAVISTGGQAGRR